MNPDPPDTLETLDAIRELGRLAGFAGEGLAARAADGVQHLEDTVTDLMRVVTEQHQELEEARDMGDGGFW